MALSDKVWEDLSPEGRRELAAKRDYSTEWSAGGLVSVCEMSDEWLEGMLKQVELGILADGPEVRGLIQEKKRREWVAGLPIWHGARVGWVLMQCLYQLKKVAEEWRSSNWGSKGVGSSWFRGDLGICGNVSRMLERGVVGGGVYDPDRFTMRNLVAGELRGLGLKWVQFLDRVGVRPYQSGASTYPVGGEVEFERGAASGLLWLNDERMAYLDWMLGQLEEEAWAAWDLA